MGINIKTIDVRSEGQINYFVSMEMVDGTRKEYYAFEESFRDGDTDDFVSSPITDAFLELIRKFADEVWNENQIDEMSTLECKFDSQLNMISWHES